MSWRGYSERSEDRREVGKANLAMMFSRRQQGVNETGRPPRHRPIAPPLNRPRPPSSPWLPVVVGGFVGILIIALALIISSGPLLVPLETPTPEQKAVAMLPTETATVMLATHTPTLTATPMPTATPTATRVPTQTPTPAPVITLLEPLNGVFMSGLVTFRWTWSGTWGPDEFFDVRVCEGEGCEPQFGITNTRDFATYPWCPDAGEGIYRWKVEVIDSETKQSKGPTSEVWEFDWRDGCPSPGPPTPTPR